MAAKTERYKFLRKQYQSFARRLQGASGRTPERREGTTARKEPEIRPKEAEVARSNEVVERYFQSLEPERVLRESDGGNQRSLLTMPSGNSNMKANERDFSDRSNAIAVADEIMNSIYSKTKNFGDKGLLNGFGKIQESAPRQTVESDQKVPAYFTRNFDNASHYGPPESEDLKSILKDEKFNEAPEADSKTSEASVELDQQELRDTTKEKMKEAGSASEEFNEKQLKDPAEVSKDVTDELDAEKLSVSEPVIDLRRESIPHEEPFLEGESSGPQHGDEAWVKTENCEATLEPKSDDDSKAKEEVVEEEAKRLESRGDGQRALNDSLVEVREPVEEERLTVEKVDNKEIDCENPDRPDEETVTEIANQSADYNDQYDESGQPLHYQDSYENQDYNYSYDENGQFVPQYQGYDEQGQPLDYQNYEQQAGYGEQVQYDENGQPVNYEHYQYDENGQPLQQTYDEQNQGYYDQNYDYNENGQPLETHQREEALDPSEQPSELAEEKGREEEPQETAPEGVTESLGDANDAVKNLEHQKETVDGAEEERMPRVMEMLDTDTESAKQDTKASHDSDFDFSESQK